MITETASIYVDIDSLLDLRQAALTHLVKQKRLAEFLNSDEYNFREIDRFKDIDMVKFHQHHNEKDSDLISRSTITYILNVLKTKVVNLEKRNNFYGESKKPEVLLNIYPFILTQQEQEEIQNALFIKLETNCLISIISKPIEEVSPFFIKSNDIIAAFIYNFSKWANAHSESLSKSPLKDTLLYFPSIYYDTRKQEQLSIITKLGFKDIFSYLEYLFSGVASINFLPTVFYSNIITASIILEKYNRQLVKEPLGDTNVNISSKI